MSPFNANHIGISTGDSVCLPNYFMQYTISYEIKYSSKNIRATGSGAEDTAYIVHKDEDQFITLQLKLL